MRNKVHVCVLNFHHENMKKKTLHSEKTIHQPLIHFQSLIWSNNIKLSHITRCSPWYKSSSLISRLLQTIFQKSKPKPNHGEISWWTTFHSQQLKRFYFNMVSFVSAPDESNPALWLAAWKCKMEPSCPLLYWPSLLGVYGPQLPVSVHKHTQKNWQTSISIHLDLTLSQEPIYKKCIYFWGSIAFL